MKKARNDFMKKVVFILTLCFASLAIAEPAWIDVRTIEEYQQDHIDGDVRISHEQIVTEVEKLFPDKTQAIYLYCRSGRRAGIAMAKLEEAGYTNVSNMGGISDVRKVRVIK